MTVYFNEFSLLNPKTWIVSDATCDDCVILPKDSRHLCELFFSDFSLMLHSSWYNSIINAFDFELIDDTLWCLGMDIAYNVNDVQPWDEAVYNGYLLFLLLVRPNGEEQHYNVLVVISTDNMQVIGSVSSRFGGVSTAKLSRFILATPEVDWSV